MVALGVKLQKVKLQKQRAPPKVITPPTLPKAPHLPLSLSLALSLPPPLPVALFPRAHGSSAKPSGQKSQKSWPGRIPPLPDISHCIIWTSATRAIWANGEYAWLFSRRGKSVSESPNRFTPSVPHRFTPSMPGEFPPQASNRLCCNKNTPRCSCATLQTTGMEHSLNEKQRIDTGLRGAESFLFCHHAAQLLVGLFARAAHSRRHVWG